MNLTYGLSDYEARQYTRYLINELNKMKTNESIPENVFMKRIDQMEYRDAMADIARSLLRTEHYICPEDAWYSCPESGASLNHHLTKCDCGFDAYNDKVNQIIEYIQST